jgi:hypothetical protein
VLGAAEFDARPPSRYGLGRRCSTTSGIFFLAGVLGHPVLAEPLLLYRQHGANDSGGGSSTPPADAHALDDYRRAAAHTAACADYLDAAAARGGAAAERLRAGAGGYRRAATSWALRASLYEPGDRRARARVLGRLLARRAYGPRPAGGFGRAALGKDLVAGVALRVAAR